ncbi:putative cyclin-D6-1 [Drosera capensis]
MEFDLENPLTDPQDSNNYTLNSLFNLEDEHMVSQHYVHNLENMDSHANLRRETVSIISQFTRRFDPSLSYLAVNYMDRFFSSQGMPQAKTWVMRLLAMACVSLATKMMKTESNFSDIQCDQGFIFDSRTVERMELLILGAVQWRMRSITPFSFLQSFMGFFKLKDPPLIQALKARAIEIIFISQNEIKLMEFKSSMVAAAALLSASHELFPIQFPCFRRAISSCSYVHRETLASCCNVMQGMLMEGYESAFDNPTRAMSSSDTPINILDRNWSSNSTTTTTTTITMTSSHSDNNVEREVKRRRKTGVYCSIEKPQLSQIQRC